METKTAAIIFQDDSTVLYVMGEATFSLRRDGRLCVTLPPNSGYLVARGGLNTKFLLHKEDGEVLRGDWDGIYTLEVTAVVAVRGLAKLGVSVALLQEGKVPQMWVFDGELRRVATDIGDAVAEARSLLAEAGNEETEEEGVRISDFVTLPRDVVRRYNCGIGPITLVKEYPPSTEEPPKAPWGYHYEWETFGVGRRVTQRDLAVVEILRRADRDLYGRVAPLLEMIAGVSRHETGGAVWQELRLRADAVSEREAYFQKRESLRREVEKPNPNRD